VQACVARYGKRTLGLRLLLLSSCAAQHLHHLFTPQPLKQKHTEFHLGVDWTTSVFKLTLTLFAAPLQEPFGLTLIEAAAHGVPIVATTNGGPVDIVHTLKNGILVEPNDADAVADALLKLLTYPTTWEDYASNGVTNINAYSWTSHCIKCLNAIEVEKVSSGCLQSSAFLQAGLATECFNNGVAADSCSVASQNVGM
jgi:hypothetical protein